MSLHPLPIKVNIYTTRSSVEKAHQSVNCFMKPSTTTQSMQPTPARRRDMRFPQPNTQYPNSKPVHHRSYDAYVLSSSLYDQNRRPSLAFSTLSDPSSSSPSGASVSQPVTPINGGSLEMQWSETAPSFITQPATFHNSAPLLQVPFSKGSPYPDQGSGHMSVYTPSLSFGDQEEFLNQFGLGNSNVKSLSEVAPCNTRHFPQPKASLCHRTEGLEHDMLNAMLCESVSQAGGLLPGQECNMAGLAINDFGHSSDNFYQHFDNTDNSATALSFDVYHGLTSLSNQDRYIQMAFDADMPNPESLPVNGLVDTYLGLSQEEPRVKVQDEGRGPAFSPAGSVSSLQGRRTTRRRTRNNVPRQVYHVGSESASIEVVDEAQLPGGDDGRPKIPRPRGTRKLHFCKWIDQNGKQCDGRFERSEHLKRHYGKHSSERPFACRLPGCTKRIQRGDNAGDHFKSHLKGPRPGQRNSHFEWPELQASIQDSFEPKVAEKLCKNIRRWILQNHEGESQRRYLVGS